MPRTREMGLKEIHDNPSIPNVVFFTMNPGMLCFEVDEPVNPLTTQLAVWVDRVKFKCYRLEFSQYQELCRRYHGHKPRGIVTGYAIAPGNRRVYLWPLPSSRMDVALQYANMLRVVS